MKILIVEDERVMADNIAGHLQQEKYVIEIAGDYLTALEKIISHEYDCILLDITLNGRQSGFELLEKLKELNKTDGVIIISAKDSLDDKVKGLNLGADDYLPKPFHLAELLARVKSVHRRRKLHGSNSITAGNVTIHIEQRLIFVGETQIPFNRKEFDILSYLATNKNRLVNKSALAEHVWGDQMDTADNFDFIYSQIKNLRKKMKDAGADLRIQAVYGIGYKLMAT
jgi:two-component system, OmpR family, response regulator ArlR